MTAALRYAARSHLGLGPKGRNEDSGYAGPHLLVLADGMGGHAAGDVASSMIVGALAPLDEEGYNGEQALQVLGEELLAANTRLRAAMDEDADLAGMGSTTIAMLRAGGKLAMAHIGDSRAYLLRDGVFSQITKDHSFVQRLLDEQRITEQEATHHPQRSLVTRVMTGNPDDEPDLSIRELRPGDRYLLCSDGLTDFVSPEIVAEILTGADSPDEAADRCIEVALKAHTRDNVTVVIADVVDSDEDDLPSVPQVVGAAAVRPSGRPRTRALPISPAEKAAALSRAATGAGAPDAGAEEGDDGPRLAEQEGTTRVIWLRRTALATAAAVVLVGGGYAGYQWTQRQLYIGVDGDTVALYRGINQDLGPIHLGSVLSRTDIRVADLPYPHRDAVTGSLPVADTDAANRVLATLREAAVRCQSAAASGIPCSSAPEQTSSSAAATTTTAPVTPSTTVVTVTTPGPGGTPGVGTRTVVDGNALTPTAAGARP
jgi:protein phosphatase